MPEGDSLHRAARRLQPLVGERVEAESPHPRAAVKGIAGQLTGRRLLAVEAVGKKLVLTFEGGLVLRSHLKMHGRWGLSRRGVQRRGRPWLVLRGSEYEAVLWNGPVLELGSHPRRRLGPDILAQPPDLDGMVTRIRAARGEATIGDVLLNQRLVAGIGNMWKAEALWHARVSPWRRLADVDDRELLRTLGEAARIMGAGLDGRRTSHAVYRRVGRPCRRCGTLVESRPQGDHARMAYWCPNCQA